MTCLKTPYSWTDWGITEREYHKLEAAAYIDNTMVNIIEGHRVELKMGLASVDELLIGFGMDLSNPLLRCYDRIRDFIGQEEFEAIAESVLELEKDRRIVVGWNFYVKGIDIEFLSRSKKQHWHSYLDFNDEGEITGFFQLGPSRYADANAPWDIGNIIKNRIQSALYE